jgi:hypothetical protein
MVRSWPLVLALSVAACHSTAPAATGGAGAGGGTGAAGTPVDGAAGVGAAPDDAADATSDVAATDDAGQPVTDPGRVTMRRLTRVEYDNTVKDLLGVTTTPADTLVSEDLVEGFDNLAEGLHMTPTRYLQYLDAAKTLADTVFGDPLLRGRILTCPDDGAGQCARDIIQTFGRRAWRRPLTDAEVASVGAFYDAARAETGDFHQAMKRVVAMMLASLPFLHKIERDPEPTSTKPYPLAGYELASRLSYLLWSSMPDDELFRLGDTLRQPEVLAAQLNRLLDSPRSDAFVRGLAGHWLGADDLALHHANIMVYQSWSAALPTSMATEMRLYFADFRDRPLGTFFTDDVHFVDGVLANHYGGATASPSEFKRVAMPTPHAGFLGLAGFLTLTSPSNRTSPSMRGSWILERLLCTPPGKHPDGISPSLNLAPTDNVRKALTLSLLQASCRDCHSTFDDLGFGLEHFDGVGQGRLAYNADDAIDAKGTFGGATFDGETELGAVLAKDPRFPACAARKVLTYALGRVLDAADDPRLTALVGTWKQGSLRDLLRAIVSSDAFRFRRGEALQ